jgi:hypothetical protein
MPNMSIQITSRRPFGPPRPRHNGLSWLVNYLQSVASGTRSAEIVGVGYNDSSAVGSDYTLGPAIGMLVGSSGAGSVGGTIGGTAVTVTFATSDTVTAGLLAAAIRANTTVNKFVTASNLSMAITLASVTAGQTVIIGGQTFTAVATASAIREFGHFNIDGTDTQDAAALGLERRRGHHLPGRRSARRVAERDDSEPASHHHHHPRDADGWATVRRHRKPRPVGTNRQLLHRRRVGHRRNLRDERHGGSARQRNGRRQPVDLLGDAPGRGIHHHSLRPDMSANKAAIEVMRGLQKALRKKHTRSVIDAHKSPSKMEGPDALEESDLEALMEEGLSQENEMNGPSMTGSSGVIGDTEADAMDGSEILSSKTAEGDQDGAGTGGHVAMVPNAAQKKMRR